MRELPKLSERAARDEGSAQRRAPFAARESLRPLVQCDRKRVRTLPGLEAFEVPHAAMVSLRMAVTRIDSARR